MKKGFTLLELLIVIGILAILSTTMVLVLNPAELLKRARDSQRFTDLDAIRGALGYYLANATTISLGTSTNAYTHLTGGTTCGGKTITATTSQGINGTDGWIPVNLGGLSGGSPIPAYPKDPSNSTTYRYYYICDTSDSTFELVANLESTQYSGKESTDGGNLTDAFEIGTKMILTTSTGCF